jgi:hypothetical protein
MQLVKKTVGRERSRQQAKLSDEFPALVHTHEV